MRPFYEFPENLKERIEFLLTDIDDTLTWNGLLPAVAFEALERLYINGIKVVPITGRPAGWCDHMARMWPVHGIVGENGAFYFSYVRKKKRMIRRFARSRGRKGSRQEAT